jgi:hypothetical protein
MGKTVYQKIIELTEKLKSEEFVVLTPEMLKIQIRKHIGGDQRTVKSTFSLINELNLIEKDNNGFYKIL